MIRVNKKNKGFSIIELIVVLAIIGLLVATIGPSLVSNFSSGKITAAKSMINIVHDAAKQWKPRNGNMTGISMQSLQDLDLIPDNYGDGTNLNQWNGNVSITVNTNDLTQVIVTFTGVNNSGEGNRLVRDTTDIAAPGVAPAWSTGTYTITLQV